MSGYLASTDGLAAGWLAGGMGDCCVEECSSVFQSLLFDITLCLKKEKKFSYGKTGYQKDQALCKKDSLYTNYLHCNSFPVLPTGYAWTRGVAPAIFVN